MSKYSKLDIEMKEYEKAESVTLDQHKPIIIRIDGRAFHTFTRGFDRPFDKDLLEIFQETTKYLCEEMDASIGYCQSDEISLYLQALKPESQILFSGKQQKLVSISASLATAKFNQLYKERFPDSSKLAIFDSRAFNLPTQIPFVEDKVTDYFCWRQSDCSKNAISSIAYTKFSHKELNEKSVADRINMLEKAGVYIEEYDPFFLNGTFFYKATVRTKYTKEELAVLPDKHEGKKNSDLFIERTVYQKGYELPWFLH
mgnify:CR=1 FL=1